MDHINRIRYDNRRENLRYCTPTQQAQNRSKQTGTSSQYKGVYKTLAENFAAQIRHNKKHIKIGYFANEIECAEAYDMYVVHNDMFNPLNFPAKRDEYLTKELIYPKNKKPNQSNFLGVSLSRDKFVAKIQVNGKRITLLSSTDVIAAANAYDKYIYDHKLPGRKMNFPEKYLAFEPVYPVRTQYRNHETDETIVYLKLRTRMILLTISTAIS